MDFGLTERAERELRAVQDHDVLMSSEVLASLLGVPALRLRLFRTFKACGYDLVLLCCVSDRLSNANSRYNQDVKTLTGVGSMVDFVTSGRHLAGLPLWRDWEHTPRVETRILPYDATAKQEGIVARLLTAVGLLEAPPASDVRANTSPGPIHVGLARWFTGHLYSAGVRPTTRQRTRLMGVLANTVDSSGQDSERYQGLTPDLADIVRADTRAAMEDLSAHFWSRPVGEVLPEPEGGLPDCNDVDVSDACRPPLGEWRDLQSRVLQAAEPILKDPRFAVTREHRHVRIQLREIGVDLDAVLQARFRRLYPTATSEPNATPPPPPRPLAPRASA